MKEQQCVTSRGEPPTIGSKQLCIKVSDINSYKETDG